MKVVYLLGAGATQGCISHAGSNANLLMSGLIEELLNRMHEAYMEDRYNGNQSIGRLVNDVAAEDTDFEQLITFLDDAVSREFRAFSSELKGIFSSVLRRRLADVRREFPDNYSDLYGALLDMHRVADLDEELIGILTLNYDLFLEDAARVRLGLPVDYGIDVKHEDDHADGDPVRVLKLHGSFGWTGEWPIEMAGDDAAGTWIPPGIRKEKSFYPFNAIWGLGRELLDCDVLRIIGCNLGANDWDLISMLFTTLHTRADNQRYQIEVISKPRTADRIRRSFPYFDVMSILDIPDIGDRIVSEAIGGAPRQFSGLTGPQQEAVTEKINKKNNTFEYWLRHKAELMNEVMLLDTDSGLFAEFLDNPTA